MKKSTKLISVILSIVMVLSMVPMAFAGMLKTDTYNTVEKLIQNDSLADIAESLITNINNAKTNVAGTVLRLVFTFVKNDDLAAIINGRDVSAFSDDEAAGVLIRWVDKILQENTKSLTENSTYSAVVTAIRIATFGSAKIDLSNTKNALATVYSLGNMKAVLNLLGDAKNLNVKALKDVAKKSDIDTVYAVLQFLADNTALIKKAVMGNINLGISALNDAIKDAMDSMKNLPSFLKSYIYLLIDGHADAGKFDKDAAVAAGAWGQSEYASYTADEMLAAALLLLIKMPAAAFSYGDVDDEEGVTASDARLVLRNAVGLEEFNEIQLQAADVDGEEGITAGDARLVLRNAVGLEDLPEAPAAGEVTVTKEEADEALKLSFYDLLATYAGDVFGRYAVDAINENLPKFIKNISVTDEIKAVFKEDIPAVSKATIAEEIEGAKETGIIGQLNNVLVKLAELILTEDAYKGLNLAKGVNKGNLNANLEKIFRLVLPLMANKTVSDNLGFDFTGFTADKVKTMKIEDMAVAVLKLFFKTWFGSNPGYSEAAVASATTLEQLAVLAVYYTATNTNWLNLNYDFSGFAAQIFNGNAVKAISAADAEKLTDEIGIGIGVGALLYNSWVGYAVPEEAANWSAEEFADDISDWALNYVKGIPAVIGAKGVTMNRNAYDPYQGNAYNKVNLVLNQLIDFSFLSNVGRDGYTVALDTLLNDALLGNILDFNVEGLLAIFEKNANPGNVFNTPYTVISGVLSIVDRAISCLFTVQ